MLILLLGGGKAYSLDGLLLRIDRSEGVDPEGDSFLMNCFGNDGVGGREEVANRTGFNGLL